MERKSTSFTSGSGISATAAASISSCTLAESRPPSRVMNLKPFFSEGWWLAVIMMEPLARVDSSTQTMNMAGVVHMPQSSTSQSAAFMPRISASFSRGPE